MPSPAHCKDWVGGSYEHHLQRGQPIQLIRVPSDEPTQLPPPHTLGARGSREALGGQAAQEEGRRGLRWWWAGQGALVHTGGTRHAALHARCHLLH